MEKSEAARSSRYGVRPHCQAQLRHWGFMKIVLAIALMLFTIAPALAQTDKRTAESPRHSYGWIGIIGLAGLAGLRRQKSAEHQRLAASGVNVKSVKI
jgi:MYXO-CTERM domain-containing protein